MEDAERSRAFDQAVKELKASIACRRGEINAQLRRERLVERSKEKGEVYAHL